MRYVCGDAGTMIETSEVRRHTMSTSHGMIAVEERGEHGLPVLFIHGNSSCSAVFDAQLNGPLAAEHRLIAIDLPGHGESSNALDPIRTYTRPGFAAAAGCLRSSGPPLYPGVPCMVGRLSVRESVVCPLTASAMDRQ